MAEEKGIPQYRCHRCGEVTMDTAAEPVVPYNTLKTFAGNPLVTEVNDTPRCVIHTCCSGGVGMAFIVGIFPAENVPALRERLAEIRRHNEEAEEAARKNKASPAN